MYALPQNQYLNWHSDNENFESGYGYFGYGYVNSVYVYEHLEHAYVRSARGYDCSVYGYEHSVCEYALLTHLQFEHGRNFLLHFQVILMD